MIIKNCIKSSKVTHYTRRSNNNNNFKINKMDKLSEPVDYECSTRVSVHGSTSSSSDNSEM